MLHPSTKKLIDRLVEMTTLAKIDWQEGEAGNVIYTTEGYSVTLEEAPNELVITSADGRELERATVDELAEATDGEGVNYTARVAEMTREAVRKAKGIDTAISTLLAGIDTDGDGVPDESATAVEENSEEPASLEDSVDESAAMAMVDVEVETLAETDTVEDVAPLMHADAEAAPEPDMTEAVARLADEVNGRDEDAVSSDAETPVEEVELQHETETVAVDEQSDSVSAETPEDVAEIAPEPTDESTEIEASETSDMEPVEADAQEETDTPSFVGELSATAAGIATTVAMAETASDVSDTQEISSDVEQTEDFSEPEAEMIKASDDGFEAPEAAPVLETVDETVEVPSFAEPASVEVEEETLVAEVSEADEVISVSAGDAANDDAVESVNTPSEAGVETSAPETVSEDTPSSLETGISLSSIGAGFGLGALQTTGEASGVPGPAPEEIEPAPVAPETILIDATDDMPLSTVSDEAPEDSVDEQLPEIGDLQANEPVAAKEPEGATAGDEVEAEPSDEDVSLTPRTRFNPWT